MKIQITWKKIAFLLTLFLFFFAGIELLVLKYQETSLYELLRWFDLDREANLAALFSTALLFSGGVLALYLTKTGEVKRLTGLIGFVLIFMGLDELLKIHETLEKVTGIDWQILYFPIILAAGFGWLSATWNSKGLIRFFFFGGAFCWGFSQVLEAIQWGGIVGPDAKADHYTLMMYGEEMLEMIGSVLFILAFSQIHWPAEKGKIALLIERWKEGRNHFPAIPSHMAHEGEDQLNSERAYSHSANRHSHFRKQ